MKSFVKRTRNITVNNFLFHCVINEMPSRDFVSLRIYSSKTSFFEVNFSWKENWCINLQKPHMCAHIIKYAIAHGWDYSQEKQQMTMDHADFLIAELGLEE
ncbi:hypothetical protein A9P44_08370 [Paenibacillus polymyxa]|nr:hypothetical protein A9P44_08370 [Paenibacillus polymyxa]